MISRRAFIKGVSACTLTAPFWGLPNVSADFNQLFSSREKCIPGWHRDVTCEWIEKKSFPFADFFRNNSFVRSYDYPFLKDFNVVHHNLYESPLSVKKLDGEVQLFILSAHLESIDDIEKVHLFEKSIHEAELSLGFFSAPSGSTDIQSLLKDNSFIQKLDKIECGIVLLDTQAIINDAPRLPLYNSHDTNRDRVIQTAIASIVEPVVSMNMISCDFSDLRALLHPGKFFGLGIGFIDTSKELNQEVEKAFQSMCSQIKLEEHHGHLINSCWSNVCVNHQATMDHYEATTVVVDHYCQDDGYYIPSFTIDDGLEGYLMQTCIMGLGDRSLLQVPARG